MPICHLTLISLFKSSAPLFFFLILFLWLIPSSIWFPGCFLCRTLWYHRRDWLISMSLVLLLCQQSSTFTDLNLVGTFHHLWILCFGKSVSPPSSFVHPTFGLPPAPISSLCFSVSFFINGFFVSC